MLTALKWVVMLQNNIVLTIVQNEFLSLWRALSPVFTSIFQLILAYVPVIRVFLLTSFIIWISYHLIKILLIWRESNRQVAYLEIVPPTTTKQSSFTTTQLFTSVHSLLHQRSWLQKVFDITRSYSFEIVSTKEKGIRYILRIPTNDAQVIRKNLISYLPGISVNETNDYLNSPLDQGHVITIRTSHHFAYPLRKQDNLQEYDPIAYITGTMTKQAENDLVAVQLIASPVNKGVNRLVRRLRNLFQENNSVLTELRYNNSFTTIFSALLLFGLQLLIFPIGLMICVFTGGREGPLLTFRPLKSKTQDNTQKGVIETQIKQKIDQQLFSVSLRLMTISSTPTNQLNTEKGFVAALSPFTNAGYQSLLSKRYLKINAIQYLLRWFFYHRLLGVTDNLVLSTSEISDLYHFPYTSTTQTEDLIKNLSKELPAPLALKNNQQLDVVFGKNHYGNQTTNIGLTDDDRSRHVYLIGQTGSGKTTVMYHMASQDIGKGRGLAVIDPHGDLAEDLLATVPLSRSNDLIYFNPFDIKYPVGMNLLELTPNLDSDSLELEKELVCESVVSVFRRVFSKEENADAHRIEYILRNTIHTSFTIPDRTIFTIYDLLNDPKFREGVVEKLDDENLKLFWKNEFGMAGDYQVVKMVSGVTAKVGRFLFSPTAKRILEQPHSTINFDDIINSSKILICNLAEGKLGEDTSQLLGTTIIAKIQQAAVRRSRLALTERKPFYLFVDEFQNFAMASFTKLLSGSRKFGLRVTIAEQSTSQQSDRHVIDVILANTGTVICFRTASPIDEQLMLSQFSPVVQQGEIANLPRYHFYMKLSALEPSNPFSGTTLPMQTDRNREVIDSLVTASRKNYSIEYQPKPNTSKSNHTKHVHESTNESTNMTIGALT